MTTTYTVWHLISGCLSLATGTMHLRWHLRRMLLLTFPIFLPPSYFFVTSSDFQRGVLGEFIRALYEVFVVTYVRSCETCCTSADPVSVSEHFCVLGHMWWMKVRLVCLVSLVSRVPRLLAPGSQASRCHRGGADSKQLMRRQPRRTKNKIRKMHKEILTHILQNLYHFYKKFRSPQYHAFTQI